MHSYYLFLLNVIMKNDSKMSSGRKQTKTIFVKDLCSVVEPEPDFFARAGDGEKELAPACCYVIWGGRAVAILIILVEL